MSWWSMFFHRHSFHSFVPGLQGHHQAWPSLPDPLASVPLPCPGRCPQLPAPGWGGGIGEDGTGCQPCPAPSSRCRDTGNENGTTVQTHTYNAALLPCLKNWWCNSASVSKLSPSNLHLKGRLRVLTPVRSCPWCLSRRSSQTKLKGR